MPHGGLTQMPCLLMHSLLCIQSCQSHRETIGKIQASGGEGDSGGALLDLPKLVSQIAETTGSSCINDHSQGNPPDSSRVPETSPI